MSDDENEEIDEEFEEPSEDEEEDEEADKEYEEESGTGFVKPSDLPAEEEEDRKVRIAEDEEAHEKVSRSKKRQGTGFVKLGDLPEEDEEEEEEEEDKKVRIAEDEEAREKASRFKRQGTGFVKRSDLDAEDAEEEEEQTESKVTAEEEAKDEEVFTCMPSVGTWYLPKPFLAEAEELEGQETVEATDAEAEVAQQEDEPAEPEVDHVNEPGISTEERLRRFEGQGESLKEYKSSGRKGPPRQVDKFLDRLREKGGGRAAVAWRRFFDSDGDGELSFTEFCVALTSFNFQSDVLRLWRDLAGSRQTLTLDVVDPDGAAVLDAFENWCSTTKGGPIEVFQEIDDDGSDSLTADEFAAGLTDMGFFEAVLVLDANVRDNLATEEKVLENLWPLLDQNGRGCVTADQLLFLEKDPVKKEKIGKELLRIRMYGAGGTTESLPSDSQKIIHKLVMETTPLGNKHWSQCKDGHVSVGIPLTYDQQVELHRPKERPSLKRVASEPAAFNDMSFLGALGTGDDHRDTASPSPAESALPRLQIKKRGLSMAERADRKKTQLRRKCYGGGLAPPLPELKATKKAEAVAKSLDFGGDAYPSASLESVPKPKAQKKLSFNPSLSQHFLKAQVRDQLWDHYQGEAASNGSKPSS